MKWTADDLGARHRLLVDAADFDRTDQLVGEDDRATVWYRTIEDRDERALETPPSGYTLPDGRRLLSISRTVLQRTMDLATPYRVSGEERYAERLWQELDALSEFPDWNPGHFLDVGEMTAAMAIGYD